LTILLKAPHQGALNRLAHVQGLSHNQRVAALSHLLPSAATHQTVIDALHAQGFSVTHQTAWTIDAEAPTPTVEATFDARTGAARPAAPTALATLTDAVLDKSTGPAILAPRDICQIQCHDGHDFRNAYSSTSAVLHRGHDVNGSLTVATLQFPLDGGWNTEDLTRYAESVGLPDPVASGQYVQIPVDGATVPVATAKEGGADEEVDLDQESILSTAPLANQRAYFDTNANVAAYTDALGQVLEDVIQGPGAANGGDPKIAALSTSWGFCEGEFPDAFPKDKIKKVDNILKSLNAAGVTTFAATGDNGVYDCGDYPRSTRTAVDYPASSPQVVGVGGTRLKFIGNSAANTGDNWVDTAWTCVSAETCQGTKARDTGGSGGGESIIFKQPAYQHAGIRQAPFTTSTGKKGNFGNQPHRLVPDIAAAGDPATGFAVLTTDPVDVPSCKRVLGAIPPTCKPKFFAFGGTSLSAPATAAMFTDLLAEHGATAGVGDIHAALYSAYAAHRGAFRDVKHGRNGKQKDVDRNANRGKGYELPVSAGKGYDAVTGLGAVLWPALAPYIFAPTAPTARGAITLAEPHSATHPNRVTAAWTATQETKGALLASSAAIIVAGHGSHPPVFARAAAPATGAKTFRGAPGKTYTLTVVEKSLSGQLSDPVTSSVTIPYDDNVLRYHGDWRRVTGAGDFGGSREVSATRGDVARVTSSGSRYQIEARTGPADGKLAVFHAGNKVGEIDLYSPTPKHRLFTFFGDAATKKKSRTFTFYVTGRKNPASHGLAVDIDALIR
jgi:hypothetical protein